MTANEMGNTFFYLDVLADDAFVVVVDAVDASVGSHVAFAVDAADVPLDMADDAFVPFVDANAYLKTQKNMFFLVLVIAKKTFIEYQPLSLSLIPSFWCIPGMV